MTIYSGQRDVLTTDRINRDYRRDASPSTATAGYAASSVPVRP